MKMKSLGKKIGASILAASLTFSLLPKLAGNDSVLAAGTKDSTNTCLGTSKIKEPTAPANKDAAWKGSYVYYGSYGGNPIKFRVLAKDSDAYGDSALFLDSDETLFKDYFDNTSPYSNSWDGSDIQAVLNGTFLTDSFTSLEQGAIATSSGNGGLSYADPSFGATFYGAPVSVNDKVFLLDATEVMNPAYGYSADCGWTTTSDWTWTSYHNGDWSDHEVANHEKAGLLHNWGLRSADTELSYFAGIVDHDGNLTSYYAYDFSGVAPALNVDQSKILFSTLVSGEFNKDEAEYKLTLVDDDLTIAVQTGEEVTMTGTTITVPYQITGTDAANATRTSVLILDKEYAAGNANGASIVYYDGLGGTFATISEGAFTLPSSLDLGGWGTDYFVYIVAEDINDGKSTDYASKPVKLDAPVFQFKVNNGGGISNSLGTNDRAQYADTVTLVANVPATGKVFDKWVVDSGSVTLADNESYITTFAMPAEDVEVTATYKDLDAWTKTQSNTDLGTTQIASPYQPGSDQYNLPWIGSYVYYGSYSGNPIKFRVLAKDSEAYGDSALFLDSDEVLFKDYFDNTSPYSNAWDGSNIQGVLNGTFLTGFTSLEQGAITTSKGNGGLSYANPSFGATVYGAPVSVNDKVFLLDATEVMNPAYGYSADCGWTTTSDWTWANSGDWNWHEVANREKGSESAYWWLRSAFTNDSTYAGEVNYDGILHISYVSIYGGVAPALNVDQNSIIFSSVISGTSGMHGAEYKLTIFDEELKTGIQTGKDVSAEGAKITVPYTITGADSANATQVSVLILDKEFAAGNANGASILYYDKLGGTFGTTAEGIFTLPSSFDLSGWGTDYFVYIIAEDVNGTYETDYASKPVELSAPVFTVTVTNDGNGTATASASKGTTGTEITLTATPKTGYQFKEWQVISGGVTITNNKFTIGSSSVEVKAVFEKINYTVDVVSGTADKTTANMGDKVTITADAPAAGKEFDKWVVASGDATLVDPSATSTSFTMPAGNVKVAATYKDVIYNVKVTTDGNGTASASPVTGIMGKEVVLTATPKTGYQFKEWQVISGGVTVTDNKFTIGTADVEVKAVFEKIPYSVTVVSGTADKTTATMGDTVKITADAPAAGKEFDKWVVDSGDITLVNAMSSTTTFTMPAGDVKVTATYKDIIYNVKVTTDGNGTASATPVTGTMGKEVALTATPDTGYQFKEWQVISGGVTITDNKFTIGTADVEVKAVFEKIPYSVTVVSGTADKTTATMGDTVKITADAPAAGKEFDKWVVDSGDITLANAMSASTTFTMPAGNVKVTATYKDVIYNVKVTTDGNGEASASYVEGTMGKEIELTASPNQGYKFKEWKVISGNVTITDNKFTIGTESVEIKAIFEKVAYDVVITSGTADKAKATMGETITITADAPAAGKEFDKWEVVSGAVTLADASSAETTFAMPAEKVEIKAVYKDIICKVTFETNGGSTVASQEVTYGSKAVKPADPTKDGYTFAGWYQDATLAAAFDFNTAVTADITIYAKWSVIPYYTVVEGANGTVTKGTEYKLTVKRNEADETTIDHLTGVKIDDKVLTKDKDYTAEAGSAKITIKAETIKNLSVGGHTVTVLFDDGEAVTSLNVKEAPAVPSTGEMIAPVLWIGLGCVAAAGALFAVVLIQKKRKSVQ